MKLICTVDTEEEGLWGGTYRRTGNSIRNIQGVTRFQRLCDEFGVCATYLVDAPVVEDDGAVDLLRAIQDDGCCEIGAHVHPWCNPPFADDRPEPSSYLCNLPEPAQRGKIEWLTDRIEKRFGRRPTSFRAGRYGLDATGAGILKEFGYTVDSSVIPFTDYSAEGGPNFEDAPWRPYYPHEEELTHPAASGTLLEIPVAVGYSRPNFEMTHRLQKLARSNPLRRLRAVGALDRLGIARRIKLSPEQADGPAMIRLLEAFRVQSAACAVLMFHSSSLLPGLSPYVPDEAALEAFFGGLRAVFEHCAERHGSTTLSGFARDFTTQPQGTRGHSATAAAAVG